MSLATAFRFEACAYIASGIPVRLVHGDSGDTESDLLRPFAQAAKVKS